MTALLALLLVGAILVGVLVLVELRRFVRSTPRAQLEELAELRAGMAELRIELERQESQAW